jgi:2-polyprenyl-3-methyl-5-hydroxy-6-metoxy-1,4-benzoquinol methylase
MKNCPYCGNSGDSYFAIYTRMYYRCFSCNLIYQEITRSYDDVTATYCEGKSGRYIADQTEGRREQLFDHIIDVIEKNRGVGGLLDVGTSCGFFLVAAKERKWEVKGIEPSTQAVEVARQRNNLAIFHGTLQSYDEDDQFGVITFINVLEHSAQPWLEIRRATELLQPGGLIYIRFPNGFLHSKLLRLGHMVGLSDQIRKFLVFHQYVFSPSYIRRLLEDHGFLQIAILNSPPSEGDPYSLFPHLTAANYLKRLTHLFAQSGKILSCGKLLLGVSLEAIATKRPDCKTS